MPSALSEDGVTPDQSGSRRHQRLEYRSETAAPRAVAAPIEPLTGDLLERLEAGPGTTSSMLEREHLRSLFHEVRNELLDREEETGVLDAIDQARLDDVERELELLDRAEIHAATAESKDLWARVTALAERLMDKANEAGLPSE